MKPENEIDEFSIYSLLTTRLDNMTLVLDRIAKILGRIAEEMEKKEGEK